MAHDFLIAKVFKNKEGKYDIKEDAHRACFYGYADGIMYDVFNAHEFNTGVSGSFGEKQVTKKEAIESLEKAFIHLSNYPDPNRADDLKRFFTDVLQISDDDQLFYVHYS